MVIGYKKVLSFVLAVLMVFSLLPAQAFAADVEASEEQENAEDNIAVVSAETTVMTIKDGQVEFSYSSPVIYDKKSPTDKYYFYTDAIGSVGQVVVTNKTTDQVLSFNCVGDGAENITANGSTVGDDGVTVNPNTSVTISFEMTDEYGYLALSNFTFNTVTASGIQFLYESNLGSVAVAGAVVADGGYVNIPAEGATLTATVTEEGASFLGWINGTTGERISTDATYTLIPSGQTVIKPAFVHADSPAWFQIDGKYFTDNLNTAVTMGKKIVLAASGTLPAGTYDVKSNVNLLIPCAADDSGTFYAPDDNLWNNDNLKTSTDVPGNSQKAFRTLKLETGAILNCAGALNVNGSVYAMNTNYTSSNGATGLPTGEYGHIALEAGAQVNIKSGGKLYCYGYITGSGTVTAENNSAVYEVFQLLGWRGGTITDAWNDASGIKAFPFNDYTIQNIEANFVVNYGATANVVAGITVKSFLGDALTTQFKTVTYIANGTSSSGSGLIRLSEGASVKRSLTPATGRVKYVFNGNATVAGIRIAIEIPLIIDVDMNSADYILAIPYYWDFVAASGSTVTLANDYKLLPGASLTVEGATAEKAAAKAIVKGNLYIYDTADYVGQGYVSENSVPVRYVASTGKTHSALPKMNSFTSSGQVIVNGTLQIDGAVYTTENVGKSVDKVIKGSGVIINNSSAAAAVTDVLDEYKYENSNIVDCNIRAVPVVGQLAGISGEESYDSFSSGTYTGLGDGWWYQYTVDLSGDLDELKAYNGSAITVNGNTAIGYSCNGGALQFTLPFTYTAVCEGSEINCAAASGSAVMAYSVPVTGDGISITVTRGSAADNNATIKYISKADGSVLSTQECYIPEGTDVSAYYVDEACTTKATTFTSGGILHILVEARVGENAYYASLEEAIKNAVKTGDQVTLLADVQVTSPVKVSAEQNINIDLAGKTLTYSNALNIYGIVKLDLNGGAILNAQGAEISALVVRDGGKLDLDVNGGKLTWSDYSAEGYSFSATSPAALIHCYSGGIANINIAEGETISVEHPNAVTTYALHAVINEGSMTINGAGTITTDAYTNTTGNYVNNGSDTYNAVPPIVNSGSMTIQGTTVASTNTNGTKNYTILNYDGGKLTLDGTNISCASGYAVYNWGGTIDSIKDTMIVGTNGICNYNMAGYSYTATITEIVGATTIEATGGIALSTHPNTYIGTIGGEGSTVELIASDDAIRGAGNELGESSTIEELADGLTVISKGGYGINTYGVVKKVSGGYYKTGKDVFYANTGTGENHYNASIGIPEGYQLSIMAQMRTLRNGKTYGCSYLTTEEQNYPSMLAGHLQTLPEITCEGPDLWDTLTPEFGYFTDTAWSTAQDTVYSITIPVQPGDKIAASSFGTTKKADGTDSAGIRVTWFDEEGIMESWSAGTTNSKNSNGYITVPEGAIAVCIPVWVGDWEGNWAKVVKDHEYEYLDEDGDGFYTAACTMCGNAHEALGEHLQIPVDEYCAVTNLWTELQPEKNRRTQTAWATDYYSITFQVTAGDKIWANSFQKTPDNDHTANGIRVTWFANNGSTPSFDANAVYKEFSENTDEVTGLNYITAPDGAIAVCVTMWKNNSNSNVRILNASHDYEDVVTAPGCAQGYTTHTCSVCGDCYVDSYTEATGEHKFTNYVSNGDATAEADGTKTAVCDYGCGTENTITDEGSSNVYKALKGKVISIMGDSISTYAGWIPTADGFNLEHISRYPDADNQLTVEETWWHQLIFAEFDAKLGINESWRSTEIGNIYDGEMLEEKYEGTKACMASMTRIQNLGSNGTPDLILFYGGTNDITQRNCSYLPGRVLGSFDASKVPSEVDLTTDKWDTVIEAYVTALMRMHYFYPNARIVCMFPAVTQKNTESVVSPYNAEFKKVCDYFIAKGYDIVYTDLLDSGVTKDHLSDDGTHPNAEGMDLITAAVKKTLLKTCGDLAVGEHTVYPVSHELTNVKASLGYYKGVSAGKTFAETLTGENLTVTVTMGTEDPADITETAVIYNEDKSEAYITVADVNNALTITAEGKSTGQYLAPYLQQMPENVYNTTNLWPLLEHNTKYYMSGDTSESELTYNASTWGTNNGVRSVTIPVGSGYRIYASSLATSTGIRTTWFFENETALSWNPGQSRDYFMANTDEETGLHYIEAPDGAIAVNVSMWDDSDSNTLYILNLPQDPLTMNDLPKHLVDLPEPCYNDTNIWAELRADEKLDTQYYTDTGWGTLSSKPDVRSITIPVNPGDRIRAYCFGATDGGQGIRIAWFCSDGSVVKMGPTEVYAEYTKNGNNYLTAPSNAVAVCVPMWSDNENCYVYNLDLPDNPLKKHELLDHLVDLPEPCYNDTNIWAELAAADKLDPKYWNGSEWGTTGEAKSVTVRVNPGDKLRATSFGDSENNQGIRVTWFFADGSEPKSMPKQDVYTEYTTNGYLTAPENAIAVCIPMWVARDSCEFYNLSLPARPASEIANYNGKVISIMGDSISTYEGWIPKADGFNLAHRKRYPDTVDTSVYIYYDVTSVEQTWWHQVITELGAKLGINDSWAGSTVNNTKDTNGGDAGPDAAMASMTRIQNLGANGTPDVILVFGGTNDNDMSILGTFDATTAPTPDNVSLTDYKWSTTAEAYAVMLARMQHFYPDAQIFAILPYDDQASRTNPVFAEICEHYGVPYTNLWTETDIRINGGKNEVIYDSIHPTAKTMDIITDEVLEGLLNEVEMASGENVVYEIKHELTNVDASKHYYKGVSHGAKFEETISSTLTANVTVKMGKDDVTAEAYNAETGVISIESVTGTITITAVAEKTLADHIQPLPDPVYRGTNLWEALTPEKAYYAADGWNEAYYSITFPVEAGDRIWSTSLCDSSINGSTQDGICITWFNEDGVLERLSREQADAEFKTNGGYVVAPEGATAVNVPTWTTAIDNEVFILNLPTIYDDYLVELDRDAICGGTDIWDLLKDEWKTEYLDGNRKWATMTDLRSITIPVQAGDVIWANVFGTTTKKDGSTKNGIRFTWLSETGILETFHTGTSPEVLSEDGTVTAPEGAVAVNLPVWDWQIENDMYILNLAHRDSDTDKDHICDTCVEVVSTCEDSEQTTTYEPVGDGKTHTVTNICNVCGAQVGKETTEDCTDVEPADGECDLCKSDVAVDAIIYGDVDGDGYVTSIDAMDVLRYAAELTKEIRMTEADVDGDGLITSMDAMEILLYVAEKITEFTVERTI